MIYEVHKSKDESDGLLIPEDHPQRAALIRDQVHVYSFRAPSWEVAVATYAALEDRCR